MVATEPWTENEDIALFRQLISTTLSSRTEFYANSSLQPWSGNGGDKINTKLKQLLKKIGAGIAGAEGVVDEELAKVSKSKGKKGKTPSPTKGAGKGVGGKKRKVEEVKDEEEEE